MSRSALGRNVARALRDETLRGALDRFALAYAESRARAYEGIDFEALRDRIVEAKDRAVARLDELAAEFTRQARARGAQVVRVASAAEAQEVVCTVALRHGVRSAVKSKSMATEEVALNQALAAHGIEVTETDLGEWIVQLAHQRPSHMIMPAIHLRKEQVADHFGEHARRPLPADIPELVRFARERLRPRFLGAGLGISGANALVAETGSLVIVSNEGNARLVTTLPPVHLALVGLEKLVERGADLEPILQALPRSATAQLLSSYVSLVTGATPGVSGKPKELHVVLLDHRRHEMARDPVFRQALRCIRCACCLNVCPIFRLVGGHVFGHVYTGGIGAILTAWFHALDGPGDLEQLCMGCGRCTPLCPARIDIPQLVVELRARRAREQPQSLLGRTAFALVSDRAALHGALRLAAKAQRPLRSGGFLRHLPWALGPLAAGRALPALADEPLRERVAGPSWPETSARLAPSPNGAGVAERAVLFAGCLVDFAYPEIGEAIVTLLARAGITTEMPLGQTCCGAPARLSGAWEAAGRNAVDNLEALLSVPARWVVTPCPTCTVALRDELGATLARAGQSAWRERANELAAKVIDASSLLAGLVREGRLRLSPAAKPQPVTFHEPCHLRRSAGGPDGARGLLRAAGYRIVELAEPGACCGMGGSYTLKFPALSSALLARKLAQIRATSAPAVATDCPGCLLQLRGGLRARASVLQAQHTVELVLGALGAGSEPA